MAFLYVGLNVRRTEQPHLAWLNTMLFTSIIGYMCVEAVIEASFLGNGSVQYLTLAIACSILVSRTVSASISF